MTDEGKWTETFAMHMGKKIYIRMCDENDVAAMDHLCETIHKLIQKQTSPTQPFISDEVLQPLLEQEPQLQLSPQL